MADGQPVGAAELAPRTGTRERYVGEWLPAQAASGFVDYDEDAYVLPREQRRARRRIEPYQMLGLFRPGMPPRRCASASPSGSSTVTASAGMNTTMTSSMEPSGRSLTGYRELPLTEWLPALEGVCRETRGGALVADIGCGHGASSILLAQAFPNSRFVAIDYHVESIETARRRAAKAGVADG